MQLSEFGCLGLVSSKYKDLCETCAQFRRLSV